MIESNIGSDRKLIFPETMHIHTVYRCRLVKLELQLQFYQCLNQGQVPQDVSRKIANGKLNANLGICEKYLKAIHAP